MTNKRWVFAVLAVLIVFTAQPLVSFAAGAPPGFVDTEVRCTVEPVFEFSLPANTTIRYPNTQALIGQFGIGELLLRNNEQLSVELISGLMAARANAADVLPYSVAFNPPAAVDSSHTGQGYSVLVTIDAAAFDDARRPVYDADLLFRVRSSLTGELLWQGVTTVTARKAQPGRGAGGGDTGNDDADGGTGIPDTGDNTVPGEEVPQGGTPQLEPGDGQQGDRIPGEEIPAALSAEAVFWWWWIPAAVLALALLSLIFFLIFKRRRRDEEPTQL